MLYFLGAVATALTFCLFWTRNWMLGMPAALFWFFFGGWSITISTTAWDFHFLLGWASILGMGTFSALGAFGVKESKDTGTDAEEYIDEEGGQAIDDVEKGSGKTYYEKEKPKMTRTDKLRQRTEERRERIAR